MKLVVMKHEGLVPASTWLSCQKRLVKNKQIGNALSNNTSWLGGKIVCNSCGRTMTCTKGAEKSDGTRTRYFSCTGKSHNRACKGVKKPVYADSLEDMVYELIAEKLADLKQHRKKISTDNTNKINLLKNELATIKKQQDKIVDILLSDDVCEDDKVELYSYVDSICVEYAKFIHEGVGLLNFKQRVQDITDTLTDSSDYDFHDLLVSMAKSYDEELRDIKCNNKNDDNNNNKNDDNNNNTNANRRRLVAVV